jgi:hypothetical protein
MSERTKGVAPPAPCRAAPGAGIARRHLMVVAATLPLLMPATMPAQARGAHAAAAGAAAAIPLPLVELDRAAMATFDAAEAGQWAAARQALARAQSAVGAVPSLESAFVEAGGELGHFFEARNDLAGDLIEAKTALSMKDRRWLVSAADRIVARAGELSQPFAARANALLPRLESLLYLVRLMRRALVWQDTAGFRSAHDDFKQLWMALKAGLPSVPADRVRALDDALIRVALSRSAADARRLYAAVQGLRESLPGR